MNMIEVMAAIATFEVAVVFAYVFRPPWKPKHQHDWRVVARVVAEPTTIPTEAFEHMLMLGEDKFRILEVVVRAQQGQTSLVITCACGQIETRIVDGVDTRFKTAVAA